MAEVARFETRNDTGKATDAALPRSFPFMIGRDGKTGTRRDYTHSYYVNYILISLHTHTHARN